MNYLESIFNNIDEALIILTSEGDILFFNREAENLHRRLGWEPLVMSQNISASLPPDASKRNQEALKEVERKNEPCYLISDQKGTDGNTIHMETTYIPAMEDGVLTHINLLIRDITVSKIFEKRIVGMANDLRTLIDRANAVIIATDSRGYITDWNNHDYTLTGYSKNDALTQKMSNLLVPEKDQPAFDGLLERLLQDKPIVNMEVPILSKLGNVLIFLLNATVRTNSSGQVIGTIFVGQDITERRKVELNLEEAQALAHLGSWEMNLKTREVKWSSETFRILGYDQAQTQPSLPGYLAVVHPDDLARVKPLISFSPRTFIAQSFYHRIIRQHEDRTLFIVAHFEFDALKMPVRLYGTMMDVSELTEKERQLQQAVEELEAYKKSLEIKVEERTLDLMQALKKEKDVVEMKSRFVSIASHEFRTPLSSIQHATGYIQKNKKWASDNALMKKLKDIEKQSKHMMFLLDDVLAYGKSEVGKIQLVFTRIPLKEFLEKIIEDVRHTAKDTHKIKLTINNEKAEIETDEKLLRNVLINLLTNAIKYSPGQKLIKLDVSISKHALQLAVEDTGMGIAPEDRDRIFEAFVRGRSVEDINGTGLGLSIVKKAVELLQGKIELESEVNKGTTVTVTITTLVI
jgi:PAS domain S-box-containing protein